MLKVKNWLTIIGIRIEFPNTASTAFKPKLTCCYVNVSLRSCTVRIRNISE